MPYEIGTAAGHYDLLAKIKAFVTDPVKMGSGNEWTILKDDTASADHELYLKGPGLTGAEEIFVGLGTYQDSGADYYNLKLGVWTGYLPGAAFEDQPGNGYTLGMPAWNQQIDYWLIANAQRIALAAKIETVYESFYLGKIDPYATPNQFPYPVIAAAPLESATPTRYSDTSHRFPFRGYPDTTGCKARPPDGVWTSARVSPWSSDYANGAISNVRDTGGDYPLLPALAWTKTDGQLGELDGIFFVPGYNNAVENTITIGADTYVVIGDIWRTGLNDYFAMRLS